jgi:hypothetical protein
MVGVEALTTEITSQLFQPGAAYLEDPQTKVIIEYIADLYEDEQIPSDLAIQLMMELDDNYQAFHSRHAPPLEKETRSADTSTQLLFANSIETDLAFRGRVWNYIRGNVARLGSFPPQEGNLSTDSHAQAY